MPFAGNYNQLTTDFPKTAIGAYDFQAPGKRDLPPKRSFTSRPRPGPGGTGAALPQKEEKKEKPKGGEAPEELYDILDTIQEKRRQAAGQGQAGIPWSGSPEDYASATDGGRGGEMHKVWSAGRGSNGGTGGWGPPVTAV
jgi:hypothetical protein